MQAAKSAITTLNRLAHRRPENEKLVEQFLLEDIDSLAPLAIEVAIEDGDPVGLILATVLERHPNPRRALTLLSLIPDNTVALRQVGITVASQILAASVASVSLPKAIVADFRTTLAFRLAEAGRLVEARDEILKAISVYEDVCLEDFDKHGLNFAASQSILSGILQ